MASWRIEQDAKMARDLHKRAVRRAARKAAQDAEVAFAEFVASLA